MQKKGWRNAIALTCLGGMLGILPGCATITKDWLENYGKEGIESIIGDYDAEKKQEIYDVLEDMSQSVYQLITTTHYEAVNEDIPDYLRTRIKRGTGTGCAIDDGHIVISVNHVTSHAPFSNLSYNENTDRVDMIKYEVVKEETILLTKDGREILLEPLKEEKSTEVGILYSPEKLDTMPTKLGSSDMIRRGKKVYVIGRPYADPDINIRDGIICSLTGPPRIAKMLNPDYVYISNLHFSGGDSGSPVVMQEDGQWYILGFADMTNISNRAFSYVLKPDLHKKYLEEIYDKGIDKALKDYKQE